ncbi:MAG: hypothetical protein IPP72_21945 [Chitinophagaceae bacterium]|nr:hypothetical protein [Chitinophagaceae bacterium]
MKYSHKIIVLIIIAAVVQLNLYAQAVASSKHQCRFHSFNSVQLLNGASAVSAAFHSVNGLQVGKLFTGIGAGFDYYYHRSVPLFLEARYNLPGTGRILQVFANGGIHIPYGNTNQTQPSKTGVFKAGRLLAMGIDYYIPLKKDAVVIGIGYSQKKITQLVDNNVWNPVVNHVENIPIKEGYEFNRIWLKLGLVF